MENIVSILSSIPSNSIKTAKMTVYDNISILIRPSSDRANSMLELILADMCWKSHFKVLFILPIVIISVLGGINSRETPLKIIYHIVKIIILITYWNIKVLQKYIYCV